jgi:hypothetical protein
MQLWQIVAIGVSIVLIAAAAWFFYDLNRARRLRERFGNDNYRHLSELGDVASLSAPDRERFISEWRRCQSKFADNPAEAVLDADNILTRVMQARGYEIHDRRDLVRDVCVTYPNIGLDYREASDIVILQRKGYASTEDLRKAFLNFRSVFDEMVENKAEFRRVG